MAPLFSYRESWQTVERDLCWEEAAWSSHLRGLNFSNTKNEMIKVHDVQSPHGLTFIVIYQLFSRTQKPLSPSLSPYFLSSPNTHLLNTYYTLSTKLDPRNKEKTKLLFLTSSSSQIQDMV